MDVAAEPSKPAPPAASLLSIGPVNHKNAKGKFIASVSTLSTLLVKSKYLQKIGNSTFSDANMKKFIELDQGLRPDFGFPTMVVSHSSSSMILVNR